MDTELALLKEKIIRQKGEFSYEKISEREFNALISLLQENYPITSLSFFKFDRISEMCKDPQIIEGYKSNYFYRHGILILTLEAHVESALDRSSDTRYYISPLDERRFVRLMGVLLTNRSLTHLTLTKDSG